MNLVLWYEDSSAAIPFLTLVALLALWFGVSVPLTFVGAFFGFRKRPIEHPVRTNQIPRQVPDQSCYTQVIEVFGNCFIVSISCTHVYNQFFIHVFVTLQFLADSGRNYGWSFALRMHLYSIVLRS